MGAGVGATSLGVARFAALSGTARALDVTAIDVDAEALEVFRALASDLRTLPGVPNQLQTHVGDLASWSRSGSYDLIVLGLVLNELHGRRGDALLQNVLELAGCLAPDGALIIIEPALRETSRALHALRDALAARSAAPYVFAPCLRDAACPMLARPRDFCHERLLSDLPASLADIASSAGLRERDLTYSYLTLTPQKRSLRELGAGSGTLYRAVSGQLESKGKTEVWLCGEDAAPRAQRLDRQRTEHNAELELAERGGIIRVSNAEPPSASGLMRIGKTVEITVVQRWERASKPPE